VLTTGRPLRIERVRERVDGTGAVARDALAQQPEPQHVMNPPGVARQNAAAGNGVAAEFPQPRCVARAEPHGGRARQELVPRGFLGVGIAGEAALGMAGSDLPYGRRDAFQELGGLLVIAAVPPLCADVQV